MFQSARETYAKCKNHSRNYGPCGQHQEKFAAAQGRLSLCWRFGTDLPIHHIHKIARRVALGLETNPGRRFALWALMYMLGVAPDLDVAFKDEAERNTARDFMDMVDRQVSAEPPA